MTEKNQNLTCTASKTGDFQPLFENLSHVIAVSRNKFDLQRASNGDKQRWARLLILGCQTYADLLEKVKLEEIEERIKKIEARSDLK